MKDKKKIVNMFYMIKNTEKKLKNNYIYNIHIYKKKFNPIIDFESTTDEYYLVYDLKYNNLELYLFLYKLLGKKNSNN